MPTECFFDTKAAMFEQCSADIAASLDSAIKQRGTANLLLSGGSTPKPVYQALAQSDVAWPKVLIGMVDERRVPLQHSASNEAMISTSLVQASSNGATFMGLFQEASSLQEAASKANEHYRAFSDGCDVMVLGMGPDGHTASLFPAAEGLAAAMRPEADTTVFAITARQSAVTGENTERLSIGLNTILKSKHIILLISGTDKLAIYKQALCCSDLESLPVAAVIQQQKVPVSIYWAP